MTASDQQDATRTASDKQDVTRTASDIEMSDVEMANFGKDSFYVKHCAN